MPPAALVGEGVGVAGEGGEVKAPQTAAEVRDFIGSNFNSLRYGRKDELPCDEDAYSLTAHDLLSAFHDAEDFQPPQPTPTANPRSEELSEARRKLRYFRDVYLLYREHHNPIYAARIAFGCAYRNLPF